ncbi:MAG: CPBP family intramembrane metalloprotease [Actinomycetota bacterium]|nr:CPBP family intramembrane metalloprotease [Actinomycetota bacterium]
MLPDDRTSPPAAGPAWGPVPPPPPAIEIDAVRWGMGDAVLGTLLTLFVPALVGSIALVASGRSDFAGLSLALVALLQVPLWAGLLGAPLWSTYGKGRHSLAADFGLSMRGRDVPLGLLAGFATQLVLVVVIALVYPLLGIDPEQVGSSAEELTSVATDTLGVVLLVAIVAVAAPLFEELFYRGLWLRAVERRLGTGWAVAISSLVFGIIHFQIYDLPALLAFGLVAALLTVRTGRLGPAIWAHVAFNLTAVISLLADLG